MGYHCYFGFAFVERSGMQRIDYDDFLLGELKMVVGKDYQARENVGLGDLEMVGRENYHARENVGYHYYFAFAFAVRLAIQRIDHDDSVVLSDLKIVGGENYYNRENVEYRVQTANFFADKLASSARRLIVTGWCFGVALYTGRRLNGHWPDSHLLESYMENETGRKYVPCCSARRSGVCELDCP